MKQNDAGEANLYRVFEKKNNLVMEWKSKSLLLLNSETILSPTLLATLFLPPLLSAPSLVIS